METLILANNRINSVKYYDFARMNSMKELYLEKNVIGQLESKVFDSQTRLTKLHLENNKLKNIKKDTLSSLKRLTHLFLDNNELETLPEDIPFMPHLELLTMSSNQIKTIHWSSFFNLNKLDKLYIFDNPFECNCDNQELHQWLVQQSGESGKTYGVLNLRAFNQLCSNDGGSSDMAGARSIQKITGAVNCTTPDITDLGQERRFAVDSRYNNMYEIGTDAYLFCSVTGNPKPMVTWYTPKNDKYNIFNPTHKYTVFDNGTIRIRGLSSDDSGKFMCTGHLVSSQDTRFVTINAIDGEKPEILGATPNLKTTAGSQTRISCNITGDPWPSVQWKTPRGKLLQSTDFSRDGKFSKRDFSVGSELVIRNIISEDSGEWSCIVTNFLAAAEEVIGVSVEETKSESAQSIVMISGLSVVGLVVAVVIGILVYYLHGFRKSRARTAVLEEVRKQREDEQHGMRI